MAENRVAKRPVWPFVAVAIVAALMVVFWLNRPDEAADTGSLPAAQTQYSPSALQEEVYAQSQESDQGQGLE